MLTERKLRVLEAIINDFLESAQPVGSRTISRKYLVGISPATIRNEMADLEELGYLFQPHTSAGRIPSDLGYRFFVDTMLDFGTSHISELQSLSPVASNKTNPRDIAERTAEVLAEATNCVVVVSMPSFGKAKLENLKLIKVYRGKVLMIMVTRSGKVRYVEMNSDLEQDRLDVVASTLLNAFIGKTVEEVNVRAVAGLGSEGLEYFIPSLREALKSVKTADIVVSGTKAILESQCIHSAEELKELMDCLDETEQLDKVFSQIVEEKEHRLGVKIGEEFENPSLSNYAVLCADFGHRDSDRGYIGIIGPKRMDYATNGELTMYFAKMLTEAVSGIYL